MPTLVVLVDWVLFVKESLKFCRSLILVRICDVHPSIDYLTEVAWLFFLSHISSNNDLEPKNTPQRDLASGGS